MGCSHAAGCPFSPYLRRACKAGASTTATAQINGSAVPATRCHSPASACRSACCPTEPARDTSKRRPRRADPAPPARRPPLDSPRRHDPPGSPEPASWPQPAPTQPHEQSQSGPGTATPEAIAQFEATPPPADVWHDRPSPPPQVGRPSDRLARQSRHAPAPKRGWWARFADWMRGPA